MVLIGSYHSLPGSWELKLDHRAHGVAGGFMIDANSTHDSKGHAVLNFTLHNLTVKEIETKRIHMVAQFVYFRTYKDGGVVDLTYCNGKKLNVQLDTLWKDKDYKFSHPHVHSMLLLWHEWEPCRNHSAPTIQLVHRIVDDLHGLRKTQRFKLISIKICKE